ncbi:hypothetical protein [Marilutibacter alkalisoli]|uniref:Uncharacterized protein n=1 Tax=Marilutibacter alkalisoli TaxID=2591633 RepID=A0A514BQF0_9GAMM|nr:hypothetical protein [Lysobacter alkalisoli]QDH69628.1 hypothetical protein FKV23_05635 [Lysobacter alkalisoli]
MDLPPVAADFKGLVERCDAVEAHLPQLHVEFAEPRRFEAAFAAIASALLANAARIDDTPEDAVAYVRGRLAAMQAKPGGLPGATSP